MIIYKHVDDAGKDVISTSKVIANNYAYHLDTDVFEIDSDTGKVLDVFTPFKIDTCGCIDGGFHNHYKDSSAK